MKALTVITAGLFLGLAGCSQSADAPETAVLDQPVFEAIVFENEGWSLHGNWRASGKGCVYPAALLLHRAAGSRAEYDTLAMALTERGVASLALDLRGHGDSTNLGRFEEPYADNLHINEGAYRDIMAAFKLLAGRDDVDPARLAIAGASYSGEAVAVAAREGAVANSYVMLSPGNFSEESVAAIEGLGANWLFVRTEEESPVSKQYIDEIFDELEDITPSAERLVYPGAGHATRILEAHPQSVTDIADWIADKLSAGELVCSS